MWWIWVLSCQSSRTQPVHMMRAFGFLKSNIIWFLVLLFTFLICLFHYLSLILQRSLFHFDSVILCNLLAFLSVYEVLFPFFLKKSLFLYISDALCHCGFQVLVSFIFCLFELPFSVLSFVLSHFPPLQTAGAHTLDNSWSADYATLPPLSENTWVCFMVMP